MQFGPHPYEIGSRQAPGVTVMHIAHALSRINRFTGHTRETISVARHSVYVSKLLDMDPLVAMYGLVHELHETVVNDISQPVKAALGYMGMKRLRKIADAADTALYEVVGVPYPVPKDIKALVKRADNAAVLAEKRDLMPECDRPWNMVPGYPASVTALPTLHRGEDTELFLDRYVELSRILEITPKQWEASATS
jgi:hypothetical protein